MSGPVWHKGLLARKAEARPWGAGPGLNGGRYRILQQLADDRFEAEDRAGTRVILRRLAERCGRDVLRDALAAHARLGSPHILPLLDGGVEEGCGRAFVVHPKLAGQTLAALLDVEGELLPTVAVRLICQVAHAVQDAHSAGLLHLGLDPSWIYLQEEASGHIVARTAGFGLPVRRGAGPYVAPEQLRPGTRVDGQADIWALGCILYGALAGAPPAAHVPPLQEVAPWVPGRLAEIVHGLLVPEPERRCPSVAELLHVLEPRAGGVAKLRPSMLVAPTRDLRAPRAAVGRPPGCWRDVIAPPIHAAVAPADDPMVGVTIGTGYTLVRLLGRGGMASVYEASGHGQRVALKLVDLPEPLDRERATRLAREALAGRTVVSPNVVKILDADADRRLAKPYIVMELLSGRDLQQAIDELGPLEPAVVARIFVQACAGLEAAHAQRIIHRDIKPANLFLHEQGEDLVVKICDFGTAKLASALAEAGGTQITTTGTFLGSPRYMSPEQARDPRIADERSDVWSLSVSLHEALGGRALWSHGNLHDLLHAINGEPVPPLDKRAPWLDPGLVAVVHRGLARDPAERHPTVSALAAALRPHAGPGAAIRKADVRQAAGSPPHRSVRERSSAPTVEAARPSAPS